MWVTWFSHGPHTFRFVRGRCREGLLSSLPLLPPVFVPFGCPDSRACASICCHDFPFVKWSATFCSPGIPHCTLSNLVTSCSHRNSNSTCLVFPGLFFDAIALPALWSPSKHELVHAAPSPSSSTAFRELQLSCDDRVIFSFLCAQCTRRLSPNPPARQPSSRRVPVPALPTLPFLLLSDVWLLSSISSNSLVWDSPSSCIFPSRRVAHLIYPSSLLFSQALGLLPLRFVQHVRVLFLPDFLWFDCCAVDRLRFFAQSQPSQQCLATFVTRASYSLPLSTSSFFATSQSRAHHVSQCKKKPRTLTSYH